MILAIYEPFAMFSTPGYLTPVDGRKSFNYTQINRC